MTREVESPLVTPWYHFIPNILNIRNATLRKCSSGGIDGRKMEERGVERNMARERRWNKKMKNMRGNVIVGSYKVKKRSCKVKKTLTTWL